MPELLVVGAFDPFAEPLRVLHVWQPTEAGVPRYAWGAAQFQADHGWDVHVACPNPTAHDRISTHLWNSDRSPVKGVRREQAALRRILDEVDPDLVVAHSAKAGLVVRLTVRGRIPTVYIPHAWPHLALPAAARPVAVGWEKFGSRWVDAIVAVGDGEAAEGEERGIAAPMYVVRNPVPAGWAPADEHARMAARRMLDLPAGPIAVCVGRFSRQKGQDVLVEAWRAVRVEVPDATLVLVGDGPMLAEVRAAAGPGVLLPGSSSDPRPYLAAADVAVLPSRWEGLSLSMLEAMASARSLVVTDVSGCEVVREARAGAVVATDNPAALAAALVPRLRGEIDADAEGRRGAEYVEVHHDFDTEMMRLALVERLVADRDV